MTKQEVLKIMAVLETAFPNFYKTSSQKEAALNLWFDMFADDSYNIIAAAVKGLIATKTNSFPPTIGEVKEAAYKLTAPEEMTEQEAWSLVAKALENSGYNAVSEFAKLPEVVQRIVGSPSRLHEWAMMDVDSVNSVVASNFQRSYRARAASERDYLKMPQEVRRVMHELAAGFKMPEIERR